MNNFFEESLLVWIRVVAIALTLPFCAAAVPRATHGLMRDQKAPATTHSSKRMADGKEWMTENLKVKTDRSYCYDDSEVNCRRYGRLYTWESAQQACRSLGDGWRLPTNAEWAQMAKHYGGVRGDSDDGGKAAYSALTSGGSSGLNVLFGGRRNFDNGQYARLEDHGFYWTSTENDSATAWFYNFGGARYLNRHSDGNKQTALSARCIRD